MGIGPEGRIEVSRAPYGGAPYFPFPQAKFVPYDKTWRDVTIRIDQLPGPQVRVRVWHNQPMSSTPLYDFSGEGVSNDKGFLWVRTDFTDFEYDSITVVEL